MNIFELTDAQLQLQQMLDDDTDNETLLDTLQSIEEATEDKINGIVYILKNKERRIEALKATEKEFTTKRRAEENNVKRLKELIEMYLHATQKRKVETDKFTVRIQKNAPSLEVVDEDSIPDDWFIVPEAKPRLDKRNLLKHIKETGEIIEGVEVKQTESIRIK